MYIEDSQRTLTIKMATEVGFDHAGYADISKMEFLPEIREMCKDNRCGKYGKSWACPPACGTLHEIKNRILQYDYGMILQATEKMEDDYDWDAIQLAIRRCKDSLSTLSQRLRDMGKDIVAMGMDGCSRCSSCTYPDSPCRFPDELSPSMEACGLFVTAECERVGIRYNYGPQTMTINATIFIKE